MGFSEKWTLELNLGKQAFLRSGEGETFQEEM